MDKHSYLCDIPQPDARGQITWACAVCACLAAQQGKRLGPPVPVTIKRVRLPQRWVNVPVCKVHEHVTDEQRQGATMFMVMEETFKVCGGGPITEADIDTTLARNEEGAR